MPNLFRHPVKHVVHIYGVYLSERCRNKFGMTSRLFVHLPYGPHPHLAYPKTGMYYHFGIAAVGFTTGLVAVAQAIACKNYY